MIVEERRESKRRERLLENFVLAIGHPIKMIKRHFTQENFKRRKWAATLKTIFS
jgi:hypothetical protein